MPLNALILRSLETGGKTLAQLRKATGSPAQSTLRTHLRYLRTAGAVAKHRQDLFPGTLEYRLEKPGTALCSVLDTVERWLAHSPQGPVALGGEAAKSAVKALAEGWSTTMIGALAVRPRSLTELARLIPHVSYPSLERRLGTMHTVGQLEPLPGGRNGAPYAATEWLRLGIAPLAAAAAWELRHAQEAATIDMLDVETAFLLSLPLVRLSRSVNGECRLAVEVPSTSDGLTSVLVRAVDGTLEVDGDGVPGDAAAWATGSVAAWFAAVIDADPANLELGGDVGFARALLDALRLTLFGAERGRSAIQP